MPPTFNRPGPENPCVVCVAHKTYYATKSRCMSLHASVKYQNFTSKLKQNSQNHKKELLVNFHILSSANDIGISVI